MTEHSYGTGLSSISVIVNNGTAHKVSRIAREQGALGCTTLICRYLIANRLLESLELNDDRKELLFILCETPMAGEILRVLNEKLKLVKSKRGIAFCTDIVEIRGAHSLCRSNLEKAPANHKDLDKTMNEGEKMYNSIYVVVDKGKANDVVDIAEKAGCKGGTIFNARGAGIHETSKLFALEVEPEKEVALLLTREDETDAVATAIVDGMNLNKPGNGLLYIQKITKIFGAL